jgi:DNA-binding response OmpR family regulator
MNLPGMTGPETCRKARLFSDMPMIVMTVRDAKKDKAEVPGPRVTQESL